MAHAVYKYELGLLENQVLLLPEDARILRCGVVEGKGYLWAMVHTSPNIAKEHVHIEMYKTGQDIPSNPDDLEYIGFCPFHVGMEIALYTFENVSKRGYPPEEV